jgi:uncharacterized membrane protein YgdD (TMEM256/DUF423 family)
VRIAPLAAFIAALAVVAGAFGAHALGGQQAEWAKTGAFYALVHAVAVLSLVAKTPRIAGVMLGGATLFSVTLYAMALGAPRWLGAVTPVGGALMIIAWIWLAWEFFRAPK